VEEDFENEKRKCNLINYGTPEVITEDDAKTARQMVTAVLHMDSTTKVNKADRTAGKPTSL
jgi:hypothetical protein